MTDYVGKAMPRYDGIGQVTGEAVYVDDVRLPGMLYAKLLRSPVSKGTIRRLDVSAAERTPGVAGVVTASDIPGANVIGIYGDQPALNPGAGVITSLVRADGIVRIPRFSEGVDTGAEVTIELYTDPAEIDRTIVHIGSHDLTLDLLAQHLAELTSD